MLNSVPVMSLRIFLFLLSFNEAALGQLRSPEGDLPFLRMTGYSETQQDVFSLSGNPAAAAFIRKPEAGAYAESRFLPALVHIFSLAAARPLRQGHPGFHGSLLRAGPYSEAEAGIVYSKTLGSLFSVGAGFTCQSVKAAGYRPYHSFHTSLGMMLTPLPHFRMGIHATDPVGLQIPDRSGQKLAPRFAFGMGYEPAAHCCLSMEFLSEGTGRTSLYLMLQYALKDKFFLRSGFMTGSDTFFTGLGFAFRGWHMMFLVSHHPALGPSSSMMLNAKANED